MNEFQALAGTDFEADFDNVCDVDGVMIVTEFVIAIVVGTAASEDDTLSWCLHGYSARSFL